MKNTRIEVLIGRTINLGDYESIRVQAGVSFDVEPDAYTKDEYANAWAIIENEVGIKSKELEDQLTNKTSRTRRQK